MKFTHHCSVGVSVTVCSSLLKVNDLYFCLIDNDFDINCSSTRFLRISVY